MAKQRYVRPDLPAGVKVADLVPADSNAAELTPDTSVLCLNRGVNAIVDKYDGRDYVIPAGYVQMPYGAAVHFQKRQVVPGTKDPARGWGHKSWIHICGIDKADQNRPFTIDELRAFGESVEAIVRERGEVSYQTTAATRAAMDGEGLVGGLSSFGGTQSPRPQIEVAADTPAGEARAAHVMERPGTTDADADLAAARADGWTPPADGGGDDRPRIDTGSKGKSRR